MCCRLETDTQMLCVCARLVVSDFSTPCTADYQALLSMGFSRQEYWSALPFPTPGDISDPEIRSSPCLLHLLHWQVDSLPLCQVCNHLKNFKQNANIQATLIYSVRISVCLKIHGLI